jgi:hypothetical protein
MQMTFDEIKYDVEIDDSLFVMPELTVPADTTEATDTTQIK